MAPPTALSWDELVPIYCAALTLDDPTEIARLRRVAASGKVGEEEGQEARSDAAWRLGLYYGALPDGTFPLEDDVMRIHEARGFDAALKHLVAAALDGHAVASFNLYQYTWSKRKKGAGVLHAGNASKPFRWLKRAADGGHIGSMVILGETLLLGNINGNTKFDFVKQALEVTEKDGLAYYEKAAEKHCAEAFLALADCQARGSAGVDVDLSHAEKLVDESEKPGTVWYITPREGRGKAVDKKKREILYERLVRGGDEDATGYSFVHDALKISPDKNAITSIDACHTCTKGVPEVAELKTCKTCRAIHYCSKACQRADWPRHKKECGAVVAEYLRSYMKWYDNCPGLENATALSAVINRNATPVILIRTELGDDGLHPVLTVVPKHELMNFEGWGLHMLQDPMFQKCVSEGKGLRELFWVHLQPFHLGRSDVHSFVSNMAHPSWSDYEDQYTEYADAMTSVAGDTGRTAEVREHTNLERPPRPL